MVWYDVDDDDGDDSQAHVILCCAMLCYARLGLAMLCFDDNGDGEDGDDGDNELSQYGEAMPCYHHH